MDKRTILAFVLIGLVLMVWMFFNAQNETANKQQKPPVVADTQKHAPAPQTPKTTSAPLPAAFAPLAATSDDYTTIESPLYKATINSHGGTLARFELKHYRTWYGAPVQLVNDTPGFPGTLGLTFQTPGQESVETDRLAFSVEPKGNLILKDGDSAVVTATLALPDSTGAGHTVVKRFVFRGNSYGIGLDVAATGMSNQIAGNTVDLTWKGGIKYQEHNSVDESSRTKTVGKINDDLVTVEAGDIGTTQEEKLSGRVNWIGTHAKYFGAAIIPQTMADTSLVTVRSTARAADSNGHVESYDLALRTSLATPQRFTIYTGPLDYRIADEFGLKDMVEMGARFVIRPIAEYVLLPVFRFIHSFIPNYGVVIIVFSLLIRLALWPLSVTQIRSSRKMQLLQPKITELREKYKDDQQRQQMETMRLYQEYGLNPAGGCLPLLLQMPILYALWGTLSSAIELRQAGFALWITDLSIPDTIIHLPASIPLFGTQISGLAVIMCLSTIIQQRTMITDPRQKMMLYMMPVLLLVMFNNLPSGLNLYYLTFNILSIGQYYYLTKWSKNTLTLDQLREQAKNKKKGWLARKMEEAQQMAAMQQGGASANGRGTVQGRTPVEPKKKA